MSYYMLDGLNGPDGLADYGLARMNAVTGFGAAATAFDPNQVYSDWLQQTTAAANAAVRQIQQGLNTLGYGPLAVDGVWGSGSSRAFLKFLQEHGNLPPISSCPGSKPGVTPVVPGSCPTKEGIAAMAAALAGGGKQASMLMTGGLAMAAVVAIGLLAMGAKKKKPAPHRTTVHAV